LDVFEEEMQVEQELLGLENVILSLHYAVLTHKGSTTLQTMKLMEQWRNWIKKQGSKTPLHILKLENEYPSQ